MAFGLGFQSVLVLKLELRLQIFKVRIVIRVRQCCGWSEPR